MWVGLKTGGGGCRGGVRLHACTAGCVSSPPHTPPALLPLTPPAGELRWQPLSAPAVGWPLALLAKGPAAGNFSAGSPLGVWAPPLPGYTRLLGRGLFTHGRVNCSDSLRCVGFCVC